MSLDNETLLATAYVIALEADEEPPSVTIRISFNADSCSVVASNALSFHGFSGGPLWVLAEENGIDATAGTAIGPIETPLSAVGLGWMLVDAFAHRSSAPAVPYPVQEHRASSTSGTLDLDSSTKRSTLLDATMGWNENAGPTYDGGIHLVLGFRPPCRDDDHDGYYSAFGCGTPADCNDRNSLAHPGAAETCNNMDDDCDGLTDNTPDCPEDWDGTCEGVAIVTAEPRGPGVWNGLEFATLSCDLQQFRRYDRYGTPLAAPVSLPMVRCPADLVWNGSGYGLIWWDEGHHFAPLDRDGEAIGPTIPIPVAALLWTGTEYLGVERISWDDYVVRRFDVGGQQLGDAETVAAIPRPAMFCPWPDGHSDSIEAIWTGSDLGLFLEFYCFWPEHWGTDSNWQMLFAPLSVDGALLGHPTGAGNALGSRTSEWGGSHFASVVNSGWCEIPTGLPLPRGTTGEYTGYCSSDAALTIFDAAGRMIATRLLYHDEWSRYSSVGVQTRYQLEWTGAEFHVLSTVVVINEPGPMISSTTTTLRRYDESGQFLGQHVICASSNAEGCEFGWHRMGSLYVGEPSFRCGSGSHLDVTPNAAAPGQTVVVDWSGIESPHARDWFGLYRVGAPDSAHLAWRYVSCSTTPTTPQASGSCALPLPATLAPGTYEIRMFGHNSYELLMTSDPFEVVIAGPTLAATPGAVSVGGTVAVAWSGVSPADPRDWISLTTPGAANSTYSDWVYTSTCAKSPAATPRTAGSCNFTVGAPGTIEFRLFGHNSYERIATSNPVSVTPP